MLVKTGDGALIDFEWPPMWYWVKSGLAATVGVWVALMLLAIPTFIVYSSYLLLILGAFRR